MNRLVIILLFVFLSIAQETSHTVKPDDTLWDIAGFYYQNPFLWPYIWRANLTKIEDPHWIYPDQVFVIPPSPEESLGLVPPELPPEYVPVVTPSPVPSAEIISVVKPEERIFTEAIIHRAGFIIKEDIAYWGKIVGTEPANISNITAYERIYIDRAADLKNGDVLTIYRPGSVITHPKTGKFLGNEIIVLGKAEAAEIGEEGSRCKVIDSYDIIKKGDFVIPYEPIFAPENVTLVPTTKELEGYVVEVKTLDQLTQPHVFVYLDQGEEAGIAVGDIFDIYQERVVNGKKMPDFNIAKVQVISVFEDVAIGLLLWYRETTVVKRGERCRLAMESR